MKFDGVEIGPATVQTFLDTFASDADDALQVIADSMRVLPAETDSARDSHVRVTSGGSS